MFAVKIEFGKRFYSKVCRTLLGAIGFISDTLEKEIGEKITKIELERIDV